MNNELITLSIILGLPLRLVGNDDVVGTSATNESLHSGHVGIVINRKVGQFLLQKISYLVGFITLFYWLKIKFYCFSSDSPFFYAVYPTIENPTCTYQLNTMAQTYSENNIISHRSSPLKRLCIRIFIKIIGFDPAITSLVIVVKTNAVCS